MKKSEEIKSYIDFLNSIEKEYNYNYEQMRLCDQETQDYLHKLELESTTYRDRAKLATKLSKVRKNRRSYKDAVDVLEPILDFKNKDYFTRMKNDLSQYLGAVRKVEKKQSNRTYFNRVIRETE